MPSRLRVFDVRTSGFCESLGFCQADLPSTVKYLNSAQRRLLMARESGDEGWWGSWAEMKFQVSRSSPHFTTPREVARIEAVNVCNHPMVPQNQFWEYLEFGNGRYPRFRQACASWGRQVLSRNVAPTIVDLTPAPQFIRVFAQDPTDVDGVARVLIQGLDLNGVTVVSQDGPFRVQGEYMVLQSPFAQFPIQMSQITGFQKDITRGAVQFYQVDPNSGNQVLLANMEPDEQVSSYRRYYFHHLPWNCCTNDPTLGQIVEVHAIVKLELIPVNVDTDYCLIQNLEALTEEAQSIRYSRIDKPEAKQMSRDRHQMAIGFLLGELKHYLGDENPAVNWQPFGSARFARLNPGMI